MTRRIILIVVGALIVLALMFVLWFWLFGKQAEVQENLGGFGSADDRGAGLGSGDGSGGNTQTVIGGTTETRDTGNVQTPLYVSPVYELSDPIPLDDVTASDDEFDTPGVSWLDGSGGGGVAFNPTPINQINNISIEGTAYFNSATNGGGPGGVGLGGALLGVAGGCVAQYLVQKATTGAASVAITAVGSFFANIFGVGPQWVSDPETHANQEVDSFFECVTRSLAQIAIKQITSQTISWINSGFNGEPAFVQDFGKFFTDVADEAAGKFIQGSDLSFLCSPFQLQVRIAIAQSYARRSSGATQACTLSDAVGNIENFMDGNFKEGGWPGLIAFTTVPSNNPFGAYAGAQVQLGNRILYDTINAERRVSDGGFLAQEECDINPTTGFETCKIVTPGSTIEASLEAALNSDLRDLELADSIDDIIRALLNNLITNVFQKGLANVSGGDVGGQVIAGDAQAFAEAQVLLQALQAAVQRAQQYGSIEQGSVGDIQNAQSNLTTLQNCWISKNSSNAGAAEAQIQTLEARIPGYNNNITRANTAIARVAQIQSQALSAADVTGVRAAATALTQAEGSGALITSADVTLAQQNRTTLQAEMAAINQQTSLQLNQCYAS